MVFLTSEDVGFISAGMDNIVQAAEEFSAALLPRHKFVHFYRWRLFNFVVLEDPDVVHAIGACIRKKQDDEAPQSNRSARENQSFEELAKHFVQLWDAAGGWDTALMLTPKEAAAQLQPCALAISRQWAILDGMTPQLSLPTRLVRCLMHPMRDMFFWITAACIIALVASCAFNPRIGDEGMTDFEELLALWIPWVLNIFALGLSVLLFLGSVLLGNWVKMNAIFENDRVQRTICVLCSDLPSTVAPQCTLIEFVKSGNDFHRIAKCIIDAGKKFALLEKIPRADFSTYFALFYFAHRIKCCHPKLLEAIGTAIPSEGSESFKDLFEKVVESWRSAGGFTTNLKTTADFEAAQLVAYCDALSLRWSSDRHVGTPLLIQMIRYWGSPQTTFARIISATGVAGIVAILFFPFFEDFDPKESMPENGLWYAMRITSSLFVVFVLVFIYMCNHALLHSVAIRTQWLKGVIIPYFVSFRFDN